MTARCQISWTGVALVCGLVGGAGWAQSPAADPCAASSAADTMVFPSSTGEVSFSHRLHAAELGLECSECHHEVHARTLAMPHPDYLEDFWLDCTTCHADRETPSCPQSCSACHHPSPVTIADETLSSKVVIHQSCWKCHEIGTGAEAGGACRNCHQASAEIRGSR